MTLEELFNLIENNNHDDVFNELNKISLGESNLTWESHDEFGTTILIFCCKNRDYNNYALEIIKLFGDLAKPDLFDNDMCTALIYSLDNENVLLANSLLDLDRTWLTINSRDNTAIITTIVNENESVFDRILTSGKIDINKINSKGENIFYMAVSIYASGLSSKYFLDKLLEYDVDINQKTKDGNSVLSYANKLPGDIIDKILSKKDRTCTETKFKKFDISDFTHINDIGLQKGSYGQVYPVIEISTGKTKILKRYIAFKESEMIDRDVVREIVFINLINDKHGCNIAVDLEGICLSGDNLYLVLKPLDMTIIEYFRIIDKLPHRENYILKMVDEMIKTIYNIHCLGICHNDIKTTNLMMNNGKIYAIDFGISSPMMISSNSNIEYIATEHIKAPDDGFDSITVVNEKFSFYNYYSYHSDVYSLGVTLLNLIFNNDENYICIGETIYSCVKNEDNKKFAFPIEKSKIDRINSCGDYMYDLIKKMIQANCNNRIKLHDLLFVPKEKITTNVSEFKKIYSNSIHESFSKKLRRFEPDEIKKWTNGAEYYEEINASYMNKIINIQKSTLVSKTKGAFLTIMMSWILDVMYNYYRNSVFLFDVFTNIIISLRNSMNDLKRSRFQIQGCSAFTYYTNIAYDALSKKTLSYITDSAYTEDDIKDSFNKFVMGNNDYYPISVHIDFFITKMQSLNVESKIISEFEWYIMKMLTKYLIIFAEDDVNIWNFITQCTLRFISINNLNIFSEYIVNSEYNLEEMEKYNFDMIGKLSMFN